jgi:hypothetical protein
MRLNRDLQLRILRALADAHPSGIYFEGGFERTAEEDDDLIISNVTYLAEHGLLRSGFRSHDLPGYMGHTEVEQTVITAAGMDFLADDGGLGAILGVVTIRLHDDTIRELIAFRIQDSDLPPPDKHRLLDQLRELRGESIKHLTMKLLDLGLENLPAALPAIQKALASFGG